MDTISYRIFEKIVDRIKTDYQCTVRGDKARAKIPIKYIEPICDMRTGEIFAIRLRPWFGLNGITLDFRDDEPNMVNQYIEQQEDYNLYYYIFDVLDGKFPDIWEKKTADDQVMGT